MTAQILDGKLISQDIVNEVRAKVDARAAQGKRPPCLAVILVGEDPASQVYVGNKKRQCANAGIRSIAYDLPAATTEAELLDLVGQLNADGEVDGILVQLPLPKHINAETVIEMIDPAKDLDGISPVNIAKVFSGDTSGFAPCTAEAVVCMLKMNDIALSGKRVAVVGRSMVVGRPLSMLLLHENATVTICHTRTKDMPSVTRRAEILIVAAGKPGVVELTMIIDGFSRLVVGWSISLSENVIAVSDALRHAMTNHPPCLIYYSDNFLSCLFGSSRRH